MRIGITGPHGKLGRALVRAGCTPLYGDIRGMEIVDRIREVKPDVIIHCAAMTNVDKCEERSVEAASINTMGTKSILETFDGKLVYISTDYIFDGLTGPYREDDKPNPLGVYGWSKLGGEIVTRRAGNQHLIVRTTLLFDEVSTNFVTVVARRLKAGNQITLPSTLYGSPTYIPHLVEGLLSAVDKNLSGTLNIVGEGVISRYRLGEEIATLTGILPGLLFHTPIVRGRAWRPLNAGLVTDKAKGLGIPIYKYEQGLKEAINGLEAVASR